MAATHFLKALCDEFSTRCKGKALIAGGSVRDILMGREPKDFDVFVVGDRKFPSEWKAGLEIVNSPEWHKSEPNLQETFRIDGRIVQVMKSKQADANGVLDLFDWNVSRFAYDPDHVGGFIALTQVLEIGEGKPLKLHRITYPVSTLRRGFRFSERFGMVFEADELMRLCVLAAGKLIDHHEEPTA